MKDFNKVVRVGKTADGNAFAKIEYKAGRLSISGAIGPMSNGDCRGSCGQWNMSFKECDERGHWTVADVTPAPGWTAGKILDFLNIWDKWHLNDMQAGCEHQRRRETKTAGWVRFDEHPRGLLSKPCPVCGYKYGSAWNREAVPEDVLQFLAGLPDADVTPAWV